MAKAQLNTKSIARIAAIQALYQFENENNNSDIETILLRIIDFYKDNDIKNDYELEKNSKLKLRPSYNYLSELVNITHEHLAEIDAIIQQHLTKEWTLDSLPKLLSATLRVAICEIKYFPETPSKVILNEYTDIAGDMLDEGEVGFVNSVLDNYAATNR
ncbi:MAG: transcription antitermination factor NusB [Rickettsiaceae bacterium]|nr:transcription antitermination factor NusB [Rickettsiaceae bacterium]MDP4832251.1 transcription antitermination factor NusB [Rickettsiaceae bacterium]MDP5021182.1 transcription antitermination factor NusB [Rickettsiaceae bacterium]MDP5083579.1 transcription antitermination factor NusB [Rickettsiaceae bacterium]